MRVGVPIEIKVHEYRVGLTPGAVREYVAHGHQVVLQSGAGAGIMASDDAYRAAGAEIAATAAEIFAGCDMIVKVKEPQPSEWVQLRRGQLLFTYLHLAPDPEQAKGLIASGCTAIAYETVTDDRGTLPLLAPMSEVAGRLANLGGGTEGSAVLHVLHVLRGTACTALRGQRIKQVPFHVELMGGPHGRNETEAGDDFLHCLRSINVRVKNRASWHPRHPQGLALYFAPRATLPFAPAHACATLPFDDAARRVKLMPAPPTRANQT